MKTLLLLVSVLLPAAAQVAPFAESGVSMGHLHIITPDVAAHKKLWVDIMGGKPIKIGPNDFVKFPGVLVGLRTGESSGTTEGSIVNHLGFLVPDLAEMRAKIAAAAQIVSDNPTTKQFFAMFPGGVKVEFTEDRTITAPVKHHHVHFATPQIAEMRAWYGKVFGAVLGMRGRFQAADLPGVNLSWNPADKPQAPTAGRTLDHIGFEVKDIKAIVAKAEAEGAKVETKPTQRPDLGLTIAFLVDPWGTKVELTEGLARF